MAREQGHSQHDPHRAEPAAPTHAAHADASSFRQQVEEGLAELEAALAPVWPQEDENRAKEPARQALHRLREKLGLGPKPPSEPSA